MDKVIIVTGSTKGIGRGLAIGICRAGATCIVTGRDAEAGEAVVDEIRSDTNGTSSFVRCDVSSADDCRALIEYTVSEYGKLDGLVNNAAIDPRATLLETDEEMYDHVFSVNAKGAFFCTKYAIPAMKNGGSIVHIGSTHGFGGAIKLAAYSCSKGALRTMNQHIAKNYAERRIRSNWLTVGWVLTEKEIQRMGELGYDRIGMERQAAERIPLGRLQTNEDMASSVIYLLSDESEMVTGSELHVTGGFAPTFGETQE